MPICIFCGKEKGEVVLLGAAYHGEAPRNMIVDLNPCDECKKRLKEGIGLIQMDGEKPTGTACIIKRDSDFIQSIESPLKEKVLKCGRAMIEVKDWKEMGLPQ